MADTTTVKDTDTFCVYCQEDQGSNEGLKKHLTRRHKGTYAYYAYAEPAG